MDARTTVPLALGILTAAGEDGTVLEETVYELTPENRAAVHEVARRLLAASTPVSKTTVPGYVGGAFASEETDGGYRA